MDRERDQNQCIKLLDEQALKSVSLCLPEVLFANWAIDEYMCRKCGH